MVRIQRRSAFLRAAFIALLALLVMIEISPLLKRRPVAKTVVANLVQKKTENTAIAGKKEQSSINGSIVHFYKTRSSNLFDENGIKLPNNQFSNDFKMDLPLNFSSFAAGDQSLEPKYSQDFNELINHLGRENARPLDRKDKNSGNENREKKTLTGSSNGKAALIFEINNSETPEKISFGSVDWSWILDTSDRSTFSVIAEVTFHEPKLRLTARIHLAKPPFVSENLYVDVSLSQAPLGYGLLSPIIFRNRGQPDPDILVASVQSGIKKRGAISTTKIVTPFDLPLSVDGDTSAIKNNIALLRDKRWIDIPIRIAANQQAVISIEKGEDVSSVFAAALGRESEVNAKEATQSK